MSAWMLPSGPWPYQHGVPAAGHVTAGGFWHPGPIDGCTKCPEPTETRKR